VSRHDQAIAPAPPRLVLAYWSVALAAHTVAVPQLAAHGCFIKHAANASLAGLQAAVGAASQPVTQLSVQPQSSSH